MTLGSWIVFGLIMAAFAAVIVHLVRKKKSGGCTGCSGCAGCGQSGQCPHAAGRS